MIYLKENYQLLSTFASFTEALPEIKEVLSHLNLAEMEITRQQFFADHIDVQAFITQNTLQGAQGKPLNWRG